MEKKFFVEREIAAASTLHADFYRDDALFQQVIRNILPRTWQVVGDHSVLARKENLFPVSFAADSVNEPLLIVKNKENELACLSNICTHRGKVLIENACFKPMISCGYHGRCFHLNGAFKSMPKFKEVQNFPSAADNLPKLPLESWANILFTSLDPKHSFQEVIGPMQKRLDFLPLKQLSFVEELSKDYHVNAHWALYCDNFLEGFHVPFVHPALNDALSWDEYETHLFEYCNLQIGIAKEGEEVFDLPPNHEDAGKNIYAYWFWVYPNLMFNFYPWGLSLNLIEPLSKTATRVRFLTYVFDREMIDVVRENVLDQTEMEDEAVVESVQKGVNSLLYKKGRFSAEMEQGVHHFHRLLAKDLQDLKGMSPN